MSLSVDQSTAVDGIWQSVQSLTKAAQLELVHRILSDTTQIPSGDARRGIVESLGGCMREGAHLSDEDVRVLIEEEILKKYS